MQLCLVQPRGPRGSAGNVEAVMGVSGRRAENFARDLSEEGLIVVKLGRGRVADVAKPEQ